MKNKKITDILLYILLFVTWILSGLERTIHTQTLIFTAAFIASLVLYYTVKNIKIRFLSILIITVASGIYTYEYILLYIPVLLLIVMMTSKADKQDKEIYETCTTLYISLLIFKVFYTVYLWINKDMYMTGRFSFYMKTGGFIMVLFFLLLSIKEDKEKRKKNNKLNRVYLFSIIGIFADVVMLAIKNVHGKLQSPQVDFIAWFIMVLCILYFNDIPVQFLFKKLNDKMEKYLDIRG